MELLIVGGGLAAQRCIETLRAVGDDRMSLIARIEDDLCLAHGDCEAVAPEAFRVDDVARVVGETTDERLRAAARACPAGAIVLYDADTGEEVDA
jgi:ferredoxin